MKNLYKEQIFNKAMAEVSKRRADARLQYDMRYKNIEKKYPELKNFIMDITSTSIELTRLILQKPDNADETIEKIRCKNQNAQLNIISFLTENGYPDNYLSYRPYCNKCEDSGYNNGVVCDCVKKIMRDLNCEEIVKNSSLSLCKFTDFDLDYYPDSPFYIENGEIIPRENMANVLSYCIDYADNFNTNAPSLLFSGKTGLGKTHLSLAIANEVLNKGYSVVYITSNELINKAQEDYFGKEKSNDTINTLSSVDLLILDDLGAEFETKFSISVIHDLVNTRQNRRLPTIINTNLNTAEMLAAYNERVVSRIVCYYQVFKFFGKDIRQLRN